VHDPSKVLLDLAVTLAVSGDCLADIAVLRAEPGVYGLVASDPMVSCMISRLAVRPGGGAVGDRHRSRGWPRWGMNRTRREASGLAGDGVAGRTPQIRSRLTTGCP
jgi:hypothetical protein